jgi:hypothetical protein
MDELTLDELRERYPDPERDRPLSGKLKAAIDRVDRELFA